MVTAVCVRNGRGTPVSRTAPSSRESEFPRTNLPMFDEMSRGADRAWRTFFSLYGPIVHRYARHAGLRSQDADEVLSNVMGAFVRLIQRGGFKVDHTRGRFRDYFKTVTNNQILAQRKRLFQAARTASEAVRAEPSCDEPACWEELERGEMLRVSLERLYALPGVRARDAQVFKRYVLSGEPPKEVAGDLGLSVDRVYAIKHEMLQKFRLVWRELHRIVE